MIKCISEKIDDISNFITLIIVLKDDQTNNNNTAIDLSYKKYKDLFIPFKTIIKLIKISKYCQLIIFKIDWHNRVKNCIKKR